MQQAPKMPQESNLAAQAALEQLQSDAPLGLKQGIFKKIRGGLFFALGYLLSPLCWWNDLIFNLPIAYGFGYLCSLFSPKLLIPCSIAGYWLSNVVGILLMQRGALDVFQNQPTERNLRKELFTGVVTSTIFTVVILTLIHLKILETPNLFSNS
ncbi:hypothetical protein F7734_32505 [Scytonema sp. UIC 10036]|uniref:hypothetical protein n=1 Tax=Scytonema sp. UIC 10036 TaxID=2304196 RepID=UPI0012DA0C42|nr:hypothetical protein [Scytonema sp. UIC 10036]MUG96810.1 hypothetical protein [Scytonema sp. UIC 10036]